MPRTFLDWILIILIILFFVIPICSLVLNEPVTSWPKRATSTMHKYFLE